MIFSLYLCLRKLIIQLTKLHHLHLRKEGIKDEVLYHTYPFRPIKGDEIDIHRRIDSEGFATIDNIYGLAHREVLPKVCLEVMQTQLFKRLLRINHSGLNIPSHSRGIHSAGVAILVALLYNKNWPADREHCCLAALLHDINHSAFSHAGELAFHEEIDHKELTEQRILHDEELRKIFEKYAIDSDVVCNIALEKFPDNPFSRERSEETLSGDHCDNLFRDINSRSNRILPLSTIKMIISRIFVNKDSLLTLKGDDIDLARYMAKLSCFHNAGVVFEHKAILADALSCYSLRLLREIGKLEMKDMGGDDFSIFKKIYSPETPKIIKEITDFIHLYLPMVENEKLSKIIQPAFNCVLENYQPTLVSELQKLITQRDISMTDRLQYLEYIKGLSVEGLENEIAKNCNALGLNSRKFITEIKIKSRFHPATVSHYKKELLKETGVKENSVLEHAVKKLYLFTPKLESGRHVAFDDPQTVSIMENTRLATQGVYLVNLEELKDTIDRF